MSSIDNKYIKEIQQILHWHEDIIDTNKGALMIISSKITKIEQVNTTHNANIMRLILLHK